MTPQLEELPSKLFGVTLDSVSDAEADPDDTPERICNQLLLIRGRSPVRPIVRVVFDFNTKEFRSHRERYGYQDFYAEAKEYRKALERISAHAYIMGEIVDSSAVYQCHYDVGAAGSYVQRTKAYFEVLRDLVRIWEVGNEINGEWVGWKDSAWEDPSITIEAMTAMRKRVKGEISAAFRFLKEQGATTAVTYYFNDDGQGRHSWSKEFKWRASTGKLEPFGHEYALPKWAEEGREMFPGVNYVFLSYYQDDNYWGEEGDRRQLIPDYLGWGRIFNDFHTLYPNALLGFGEVGPQCHYLRKDKKCKLHEPNEDWERIDDEQKCGRRCKCCTKAQEKYVKQYYVDWDEGIRKEMSSDLKSKYVGGYFYWYFSNDVVEEENADTIEAFKDAFRKWYPKGETPRSVESS